MNRSLPGLLALAGLLFATPAAAQPAPAPARAATDAVPAPLEGVVNRADGSPVADALVVVRAAKGDMRVATRTNPRGQFRLLPTGPGPYVIQVQAAGLAPRTVPHVAAGPLSVLLEKGATLTGVVKDGESGRPIAGARVLAEDDVADATPEVVDAGPRATTDAEGRFRLEGLGPGSHTVMASARGYGTARRADVRPTTGLELFLFPGPSLAGAVRDSEGKPVPNATVRAVAEDDPQLLSAPERTDAAGRFGIFGLPAGTYRVWARHPSLAPALAGAVTLEGTAETVVELVLERGTRVSGRLVDPEQRPLAGGVLLQEVDGTPAPADLAELVSGNAGADGRFALERVPSGAVAILARGRGRAPRRLELAVSRRQPAIALGDVVVETGPAIRGRVRDRQGRGVPEADITATPRTPGLAAAAEARSESDGTFVVPGVATGNYRLVASATGFAPASRLVAAGSDAVELVLEPGGRITGLVVDEQGVTVDSFEALATPVDEGAAAAPVRARTRSSAGRFSLDGVPAGTWMVEVTAPDRASGLVSRVRVEAGATRDVGRVRLAAGATVRGTVVDAGGVPVAGATVSLAAADAEGAAARRRATSDAGGAFELRGLSAGSAELVAQHPAFAPGRTSVEVARGAEPPAEVRLVLSRGGRIDGAVRQRDGNGVAGAVVAATVVGAGSAPAALRATTQGDGSFTLERVPPGRVEVTLLARAGDGQLAPTERTVVEVKEGQTTPVILLARDILLSGRLTRDAVPLPNLRLTFRTRQSATIASPAGEGAGPERGPSLYSALTREDGTYEVLLKQPGRMTVQIASADGRQLHRTQAVDVPDAETASLDFDLGGLVLTGMVVDAETDQPLRDAWVSVTSRRGASARSATGADGRFRLELDPGEYAVRAFQRGRAPQSADVVLSESTAVPELLLKLPRGVTLRGKVTDAAGNPVGGAHVSGQPAATRLGGGLSLTLPDGTFRLEGLVEQPHNVLAGSRAAFAVAPGVSPESEVALALHAGGKVLLRVVGKDGAPVAGVAAVLQEVDGSAVDASWSPAPGTDDAGRVQISVPAGRVAIQLSKGGDKATAAVDVEPGATVEAEVQLASER